MDDFKRIVEVNGIKVEIDLRTAKRVDQFKVGDKVKLLIKKYSDTYQSYPGILIGFDEFQNTPTIIAAYIDKDYSGTDLKFAYINSKSQEIEIAPMQDFEAVFDLSSLLSSFKKQIESKQSEIEALQKKKEWVIEMWKKYFEMSFKDIQVETTES